MSELSASTPNDDLISARREEVMQSYNSAIATNRRMSAEKDHRATDEYIYDNQKFDAINIVHELFQNKRRVISIQKKTKVGADGLMIEIAKLMTTHNDDSFVIDPANVRILTGMSNVGWEKDMIDKAPNVFKDKIYHHGQLSKAGLHTIKNSLIIIDEIDTGDKECQVLHNVLKESGMMDVKHMEKNNNRFVFISATMIKELHDLYRWGNLHTLYKMNIPKSYIGHSDFLKMGIVKEFYAVNDREAANKWIREDILDHYSTPCMCNKCNPEKITEKKDFRVHFVRVNTKNVDTIQNACIRNGIAFRNHTSSDRLSDKEIKEIFKNPLDNHTVVAIKGFFRRANLIPNAWKLRIGATLELYTKKVDNSVQIQGLVGRMTGYWRDIIEGGHKTGPYRTSIKAIEEYEKTYDDPFGSGSYQTSGFIKKNGKVSSQATMLSPKNIDNLVPIDLPIVRQKGQTPIIIFDITDEEIIQFKDKPATLNVLRKYNDEAYTKYKDYEIHCWNIDTPAKCEKYGLKSMLKDNAYSSETNIRDKKNNVLMFYLHEHKIIVSAWNGQELI